MRSQIRSQVAFRYTGLAEAGPAAIASRDVRAALLARYRDLSQLRYGFPVVLVREPTTLPFAEPLTATFDRVVTAAAPEGAEGERFHRHLLQLECEIRHLVALGASASLSELWKLAAERLGASEDAGLREDLHRARPLVDIDGELVDCGPHFAASFVTHAWKSIHRRKAAAFAEDANRLLLGLSDILAADALQSAPGRKARRLKDSVGATDREAIDFERMSQLIGRALRRRTLSEERRRRVRKLLATLQSQYFYTGEPEHGFVFKSCSEALAALRARLPQMTELARAMAMARLEVAGEYVPSMHDALFERFGVDALGPEDLAQFPAALVCVKAATLDDAARDDLQELLASGMPVKVLVQTDDLVGPFVHGGALAPFAWRSRALNGVALALEEVFVVQSAASSLPAMREDVLRALSHAGPSLLNVYSGAGPGCDKLPPYLVAAAATESRAFPSFTYDPAIDAATRSRYSIAANPQVERDWPVHRLDYEVAALQRQSEEAPFTVVDFIACDSRHASRFAAPPADAVGEERVTVAAALDQPETESLDKVACVRVVDEGDRLHELLVAEPLIRQARRVRESWRNLQRLAQAPGAATAKAEAAVAPAAEPVAAQQPAVVEKPAAAEKPAASPPAAEKAASDDPYIETPRCTSCDECTQLNNRMFAYDANKQAYIKDVTAGTYRQLVEAAESCQVSIIHPGKPRNADEPGLDELLERAAPFA